MKSMNPVVGSAWILDAMASLLTMCFSSKKLKMLLSGSLSMMSQKSMQRRRFLVLILSSGTRFDFSKNAWVIEAILEPFRDE
jgi:hypothetical protein